MAKREPLDHLAVRRILVLLCLPRQDSNESGRRSDMIDRHTSSLKLGAHRSVLALKIAQPFYQIEDDRNPLQVDS
jgi:hypothetical protein